MRKSKNIILFLLTTVLLSACLANIKNNEEKIEFSSTFSIPVFFEEEGTKGEYILIGEEGKIGFLVGSKKEDGAEEIMPIVAKKPNKYMWFLWGDNISGKSFKVIGKSIETKEETILLDGMVLGSELEGADAHIPSTMKFPSSGIWELDAYVDEELFGTIVVEVE